ncbi:MAG: DMT family transporter [Burkholderiaceae bacterium]|nr:DMT family transporter [Burkholderiaceae bacterium]MEB2317423.1 DMT family transporter [Pseudomonadota bacterium]
MPASRLIFALLWAVASGMALQTMNAVMRLMALELHSMQAQFLRALFGLIVMLPVIAVGIRQSGWRSYWPKDMRGQWLRGLAHTVATLLFFLALPHLPLADSTAIGFTTPLFILLGAALFLGEKVTRARWLATLVGFGGVLVVLLPHLGGFGGGGYWSLVMLAASPAFATSFLLAKVLTRRDRSSVLVVWQALTVSILSLPLALAVWEPPTLRQWTIFLFAGLLGSTAHYCINRAMEKVDISALQSVRFLDLIWSSMLGFLMFGNMPAPTALVGGAVIVVAVAAVARYEARVARASG